MEYENTTREGASIMPDSSVAKTPEQTLLWLILQKREDFILSLEAYERMRRRGVGANTYEMGARLRSLWEEIRSAYEDEEEDGTVAEIESRVNSNKEDELLSAWGTIRDWLYKKKVTKWDVRKIQSNSAVKRSIHSFQ